MDIYGLFLIMDSTGFISSTVGSPEPDANSPWIAKNRFSMV